MAPRRPSRSQQLGQKVTNRGSWAVSVKIMAMKAAARRGNLDHRSGTGGVVVVPQRFTLPAPRRIVLVQDETHLDPTATPSP